MYPVCIFLPPVLFIFSTQATSQLNKKPQINNLTNRFKVHGQNSNYSGKKRGISACLDSTYTKIGIIRRRLTWPHARMTCKSVKRSILKTKTTKKKKKRNQLKKIGSMCSGHVISPDTRYKCCHSIVIIIIVIIMIICTNSTNPANK